MLRYFSHVMNNVINAIYECLNEEKEQIHLWVVVVSKLFNWFGPIPNDMLTLMLFTMMHHRGHSITTWTIFWPILTTYLPQVDKRGHFRYHLPTVHVDTSRFYIPPPLEQSDNMYLIFLNLDRRIMQYSFYRPTMTLNPLFIRLFWGWQICNAMIQQILGTFFLHSHN